MATTRMQQRRGLASQWELTNPVLADGEIGFATDIGVMKAGDGVKTWTQLPVLFDGIFAQANVIAGLEGNVGGLQTTTTDLQQQLTLLQEAMATRLTLSDLYPLGTSENPVIVVTGNEDRPLNLPFPTCHWRGEIEPLKAAAGDVIDIVATTATPPPAEATYIYEENFATSAGGYTQHANASGIQRSVARYTDGGLVFQATAAGESSVKSALLTGFLAQTGYVLEVGMSHAASSQRHGFISVNEFDSGTVGYLRNSASVWQPVPVYTTAGEFTLVTFSLQTGLNTTRLEVRPGVEGLAAGNEVHLNFVRVRKA